MISTTTTFWWIWLLVFVVSALFIYLDFKSRPGAGRVIRIIAILIGVFSLLALYLNPAIQKDALNAKVVLVTSGSTDVDVDSLVNLGYRVASDVSDYEEIQQASSLTDLLLIGDGLNAWELDQINQPFEFLPPKVLPEGPIGMKIGEGVVSNDMRLDFTISVLDSLDVTLSGPGIETVIQVVEESGDPLKFSVVPALAGYLQYQLDGLRGGDTIFSEVVPVLVRDRSKTNVLILSAAPSSEYRFLKNYLAEQGFGVAERIQISNDIFRDSFSNLSRMSLRNLTPEKLEEFQLVVLEAAVYNELSRKEKSNLRAQLKAGELGVIWSSNSEKNDLVTTKIADEKSFTFQSGSSEVRVRSNTEELLRSDGRIKFQDQEIGKFQEIGLGKIVLPRSAASYTLILKGEERLYASFWQKLLQPAIGVDWKTTSMQTPPFPRVDLPMTFTISNLDEEEPLVIDSARVAVSERWFQLETWEARYWPKKRGWNTLSSGSEQFFVFDSTEWPNQVAHAKRARTAWKSSVLEKGEREGKKISQPISKWLFFIAFLFSFGFLWLDQRLS